jgi:hypothetical protein
MLVNRVGAEGGRNGIASYLLVYTPWQLAFAWFLAKLLRS